MQGGCGVQRGEDGRTKGVNLGEKGLRVGHCAGTRKAQGRLMRPAGLSIFVEVNDLSTFTD